MKFFRGTHFFVNGTMLASRKSGFRESCRGCRYDYYTCQTIAGMRTCVRSHMQVRLSGCAQTQVFESAVKSLTFFQCVDPSSSSSTSPPSSSFFVSVSFFFSFSFSFSFSFYFSSLSSSSIYLVTINMIGIMIIVIFIAVLIIIIIIIII